MQKFRVGIIGCGTICPMHARSLKNIKDAKSPTIPMSEEPSTFLNVAARQTP